MNRKVICVFLAIILMMTFWMSNVYADEEEENGEAEATVTETVVQETPKVSATSTTNTTKNEQTVQNTNTKSDNKVERQSSIFIILGILILIYVVIGKGKSIKSIVGLVSSLFILWLTMYVFVKNGANIIIMAIISVVLMIFVSQIIERGIGRKTYSIIIGAITGTIIAGFLMFIFGSVVRLNVGFEELHINQNLNNINVIEILFAVTVIAAVEIISNVASSIVIRLDKVRNKNRDIEWESLFKHGNKVGAEIALKHSKVFIITYLGNALVFALIYAKNQMSFDEVLSSEFVAIAVVSALAGTLGMLACIPATSIAYAFLNKNKFYYKQQSDNIVEGKRSLKI